MHASFKSALLLIVSLAALVFLYDAVRVTMLVRKSKTLVRAAVPFERALPEPKENVLVLGDSTAYGVGAETSGLSTAGRLGALYPEASVGNMSVSGLRPKGLVSMLEDADLEKRYSIILIQIGANDIVHLTDMKDVERDLERVLERLAPLADKLVVLHSGNVGGAPLFPWYVKPFYKKRSEDMREIYLRLVKKYEGRYVDLIMSPSDKALKENPRMYYAEDGFHLSGEGYGLWFDEIREVI